MTTIIYTTENKVIEIRHVGVEDLDKTLKKYPNSEILQDYQDIRKIDENIDTQEWTINDIINR